MAAIKQYTHPRLDPRVCTMRERKKICGKALAPVIIHYDGRRWKFCPEHARAFQRTVEHDRAGEPTFIPKKPKPNWQIFSWKDMADSILTLLDLMGELRQRATDEMTTLLDEKFLEDTDG